MWLSRTINCGKKWVIVWNEAHVIFCPPNLDRPYYQSSNNHFFLPAGLTRALLKMLIEANSIRALECACLLRSLECKTWENDPIGQLDGVGQKTREKLVELGVENLEGVIKRGNHIVSVKVSNTTI